jgi:hypothetical protein
MVMGIWIGDPLGVCGGRAFGRNCALAPAAPSSARTIRLLVAVRAKIFCMYHTASPLLASF